MILMLSGEGKTDMGQMKPTGTGNLFAPGPMAWITDRLIKNRLHFSPLELYEAGGDTICFVCKADLDNKGNRSKTTFLPGYKYGKGNAFYAPNAQTLGLLALKLQQDKNEPVVAVLFRDTDNTNSAPRTIRKVKVGSMRRGFAAVDFPYGVPMMPQPISEAWLICALKENPYCHCDSLEKESGNDNSPNQLKKRLEKLAGHNPAAEEQAEWVRTGKVDPERIDMPSYTEFRDELSRVLEAIGGYPDSVCCYT